jgi:uridylate kinase
MKVVVSIGGSVFAPDLSPSRIREHAGAIETLGEAGWSTGVVIGGGGVARDYIGSARDLGANEMQLDYLGIAVTRLNARLLIVALGEAAAPSPPVDYEEAGAALHHGDVAVMGGVAPGQTTDAVSAAFAEYVNADVLVLATSVDGVYSADPNEDADAEKFASLTPAELVDVIADIEMAAGAAAPVDLLAAKLIERAGLPTVVLDGSDPANIVAAVRDGAHDGTAILPDGADEAQPWVTG